MAGGKTTTSDQILGYLPPPWNNRLTRGIGGSAWADFLTRHTRGNEMGDKNKPDKNKSITDKVRNIVKTKYDDNPFERRGSVSRSPPPPPLRKETSKILLRQESTKSLTEAKEKIKTSDREAEIVDLDKGTSLEKEKGILSSSLSRRREAKKPETQASDINRNQERKSKLGRVPI